MDSLRAKYPKLFSKALGSLTKIPTDEELDLEHNPVVMAIQAMVDGTLNTSAPTEGRNLYFENPKSLNELLKGPSNKATQKGFKLPTDEEIASNPVIAAIKAMVDGKLNTSVPTGGRNPYVENPVPLWELLKGLNTPGQTNGTQVVGDVEIEATVTADEESAAAAAEDAAGTAQGTLDNETLSFEVESDDGAAATAAEKAAETAEETL